MPGLTEVNFSLTKEAYVKVKSFMDKTPTVPATKGTGTLKFEGVRITSFKGSITLELPSNIVSREELLVEFKKTAEMQVQKNPKVTLLKNELVIGSNTAENFVSLSPNLVLNRLTSINLTAKFSDRSDSKTRCLDLLLNNKDNANKVWYHLIISVLSKLTPSVLFNLLGNFLSSTINVSNINMGAAKAGAASLSKDGQTVNRSLTAVKNKLLKESSSQETQKLLLDWLVELQGIAANFKNGSTFLTDLKSVISSSQVEKPATTGKKEPKV